MNCKKYQKRYRERNKQKAKKYREDHRKHLKKLMKEWRIKNPNYSEKYYNKYYLKKNKKKKTIEEIKVSKKEYYKKNKKRILRKQKISKRKYLNGNNLARISARLRNLLGKSLRQYTKTGKYQSSKKYGIDYKKIIEHLKPFPKDLSKYHIDHIKPLCKFDLTNPKEIRKAFAPENHQFLLAKENWSKGGRY